MKFLKFSAVILAILVILFLIYTIILNPSGVTYREVHEMYDADSGERIVTKIESNK